MNLSSVEKYVLACAGALFTLQAHAVACQFDSDCDPGGTCVKKYGFRSGICAGGIPGGRQGTFFGYPAESGKRAFGETCQFDADCGPGAQCIKKSGSTSGACMKDIEK